MSLRVTASSGFLLLLLPLVFPTGLPPAQADEPKGGPPDFKRLKYRPIGPAAGGRVCRAAGVPGDPLTYYAAVSSGGVWKSSDGGITWKPVFNDQPTQAVGSLAIAPSDPNVLYVGSGEANIRGNVQPGNGLYKSTDAGKTWKHVWKQQGQIGTMLVHPTNSDIAYAAVLGRAFGPSEERGIYRTTDGGKNWQRVLFKDKDTGASAVCFDPANPRILFAGLWQTRRRPWDFTSGGPGSGLYTSRDGGDTWTQLLAPPAADSPQSGQDAPPGKKFCKGLPEGIWGKIGLAVAPSDGQRVYALIEAEKGGLFRSNDGGETWELVNPARALRQRAWYFSTLTVHPKNPDIIYFPQVPLLKSIDGGKSLLRVSGPHHGDHHDLWIDPTNPRRMIDSNDGGVDVSTTGGQNWYAPPLPISQFYHIRCDNRTPYYVSGPMQDIGTASGPSNSLLSGGISLGDWYWVGGGETGFTAPDPSDPNIVYAGEYGGYLSRYDHRSRQAKSIGIYPFDTSGHAAADLRYRFQWTAPLEVSPHDSRVVYHGANVLFKTDNAGLQWTKISPDLTRNDKSKQQWAGGPLTGDNTGVEVYDTIFTIAESRKQKDLIWAGSDDGLVHITRDGGKKWENLTPNIKGLPEWAAVIGIESSPFDADTAYVVVDGHKLDDLHPYLFKTADGGKTWQSLSAGLPQDSYLRVVREDPKRKGLLYVGSSNGVWFSTDDGGSWQQLKLNLPAVSVCDLVVKNNDLVVGTDGRSIWIFDDLSPIRQLAPAIKDKEVHLFEAVPAIRYRYSYSLEEKAGFGSGENPPKGAILHYYLKRKPKDEITLEIVDSSNQFVAKLSSKEEAEEKEDEGEYSEEKPEKLVLPTDAGLHRVVWDLRYEGAKLIKKAKLDSGNPRLGPLVNPGTYTLKLRVEGKTVTTPLVVKLDPRERTGPAVPQAEKLPAEARQRLELWDPKARLGPEELAEQLKLLLAIRDDISRLTRTVEQLRAVRQQLQARNELLKDDVNAANLIKVSKELLPKLDELEEKLHNPKARVSYDILAQKGGAKLYSQLTYLFELGKDSDGRPTQGLREVYQEQRLLLEKYVLEWQVLVAGELTRLNEQAKKLDVPGLILPRIDRPKE